MMHPEIKFDILTVNFAKVSRLTQIGHKGTAEVLTFSLLSDQQLFSICNVAAIKPLQDQ